MDKINAELERMYDKLMKPDKSAIITPPPNFTLIRDLFRQHINNRRNSNDQTALLMSESDISSLKTLKEEMIKIMNQVNGLNTKSQPIDKETFTSLNEFISYASSQQEILCSEMWKLESFVDQVTKIAQEQEKLRLESRETE